MKKLVIKKIVASPLMLEKLKTLGDVKILNHQNLPKKVALDVNLSNEKVMITINYSGDNMGVPAYSTLVKCENPKVLEEIDTVIGGQYNYFL